MKQNHQHSEAILLGLLMKHPIMQDIIHPDVFLTPQYKSMALDVLQWYKQHTDVAAQPQMLFGLVNDKGGEKYSSFTVQSLIDFIEKSIPKTEEEAHGFLAYHLAKLEDERHIAAIKDIVEQAYKELEKGEYNLATFMLKQAPFRFEAKQEDTATLMLKSVEESNGFKTGIKVIDDYAGGWYKGNLLSLCGDTGSQKTRASLWILFNILKANPSFKAVYFEKEMMAKDIGRMLLAYFVGIKNDHIIKASTNIEKEALKIAIKAECEKPEVKDILDRITVIAPTDFSTVADMWKIIDNTKANVWVLDYMSLLDEDSKSTGEKAYTVMDNMKRIKNMVHHTGSFGIILNQLRKGTVEQRINKIPLMDDIEWSGDIKKLSAYVLATFYPSNYHTHASPDYFYLMSLKNRDKKNYTVPLLSQPEYVRFEEAGDQAPDMMNWIREYQKLKEKKESFT